MATVTYTVSGTTATMSFTASAPMGAYPNYRISYTSGGTTLGSTTVDPQSAEYPIETAITGLTVGQTYNLTWVWEYYQDHEYTQVETGTVSVLIPDTTPKTATQSQWEDLAFRIKAKADSSDVPTITMTGTDPGEGSALAENHYIAVYGGDPIIMDYSTTEINTGAKWIDGSAIYKKTVNTGALPNATSKNVAHNISNLARILKIEGYAYNATSGTFQALPMVAGAVADQVTIVVGNTNIVLADSADRSAYGESYITLYYTKSS